MSDEEEEKPKKDISAELAKKKAQFKKLQEDVARGRKSNLAEVEEEIRKEAEDPKAAYKRLKMQNEAKELQAKLQAERMGLDYEKIKSREMTIEEAQDKQRELEDKRQRANAGFSTFEDDAVKKYEKESKKFQANLDEYLQKKSQLQEEEFYPTLNSLSYGMNSKTPESKIDSLIDDIKKQEEKRKEFSRRRKFDDNADVDYINDRNAKFNKKIARAFDPYTTEIKQNLERGTAL